MYLSFYLRFFFFLMLPPQQQGKLPCGLFCCVFFLNESADWIIFLSKVVMLIYSDLKDKHAGIKFPPALGYLIS